MSYDMALNMEHGTWLMTADKDIIIVHFSFSIPRCITKRDH